MNSSIRTSSCLSPQSLGASPLQIRCKALKMCNKIKPFWGRLLHLWCGWLHQNENESSGPFGALNSVTSGEGSPGSGSTHQVARMQKRASLIYGIDALITFDHTELLHHSLFSDRVSAGVGQQTKRKLCHNPLTSSY
eukprot:5820962-Amphidinium_carterae.1